MRNIHQIVKEINDATHFINNQIYQRYNELLDENITSAQDLLLTIIDTNKNLTIREIAEKLEITPSAASQQVSKLEEMNYVKRQINEKNRREILVSLADKGTEYMKKQEKIDLIITEKLYAKLGEEKLTAFRDILFDLKQITIDELK